MLSLVYGITINNRKEALITSFIVGIFHFFMPLIGYYITFIILNSFFAISTFQNSFKSIGTYLLIVLGLVMIFKKEDATNNHTIKNVLSKLLFAFTVSIDSFFIGMALTTNSNISIIIVTSVFFLISGTVTLIALCLIHKTRKYIMIKNLNIVAGVILLLFALLSLFLS